MKNEYSWEITDDHEQTSNHNRVKVAIIVTTVLMVVIGIIPLMSGGLRKYIIEPIVEDASGFPSSYNVVNTVIYAIELALSAYLVYLLCAYFKIKIKYTHILMFVPYILSAAFLRVLEDINVTFHYIFISPILQLFVGFTFVVVTLIVSLIRQDTIKDSLLVIFTITILAFLYYSIGADPYALTAIALLPVYHFVKTKEGKITLMGLSVMVLAFLSLMDKSSQIGVFHWESLKIAIAILIIVSSIAVLAGITLKIGFSMIVPLAVAQTLDGSATFIAVTMYGYYEKHVVSGVLIGHNPALYLVVKILLGIFLGILAQYLYKQGERPHSSDLKNISHIILAYGLALGLGPGTRDLLRVFFGV